MRTVKEAPNEVNPREWGFSRALVHPTETCTQVCTSPAIINFWQEVFSYLFIPGISSDLHQSSSAGILSAVITLFPPIIFLRPFFQPYVVKKARKDIEKSLS